MIDTGFCEPFLDYMRKYVELDDHAIQMIVANAKEVKIPKKNNILHEGIPCDKIYFIVAGQARSFYTDFTGKTITWSFHFNTPASISKNLFATDYRSFLSKENSAISIEALTDVTAIMFTKEQVDYLIANLFIYERWMRKLNENAYIHTYDRVFTLLTMTAGQRYEKLLKEEAHLLQMFSSYYIASYLGIAPQSLSRIRGT